MYDQIGITTLGLTEEEYNEIVAMYPDVNVDAWELDMDIISEQEFEASPADEDSIGCTTIEFGSGFWNPESIKDQDYTRSLFNFYDIDELYIINPNAISIQNEQHLIETFSASDYPKERQFLLFTHPLQTEKYNNKRMQGITVCNDFAHAKEKLKFKIMDFKRTITKDKLFYRQLADSITILRLLRDNHRITSSDIATHLECSTKTVQRYIETLRVAGEPISYDARKKGWYLEKGHSVLLDPDNY